MLKPERKIGRRRPHFRFRALAALLGLSSCQLLSGVGDLQVRDSLLGPDANVDAGNAADSAPDADQEVAGSLYVSPLGNDANDGRDSKTPLKTIKAALARSTAAGGSAQGFSLRVCAGTYDEGSITLTTRVSLYGGYDCAAWSRTDFGYPNFATNVTEVLGGTSDGFTIKYSGGFSKAPILSGFRLVGKASPGMSSYATLEITDGANPVVSDTQVVGAAESFAPTVGIRVTNGATPTIRNNFITGGGGKSTTGGTNAQDAGSIGVLALMTDARAPILQDSTLLGGSGSNTQSGTSQNGLGSVGLWLAGPGGFDDISGRAIRGNTIHGGTGTVNPSSAASGLGSAGVILRPNASNAVWDVLQNEIHSGTGASINVAAGRESLDSPRGVSIEAPGFAGVINLKRNRVYAAHPAHATNPSGLYISGAGTLILENNEVLAGDPDPTNLTTPYAPYGIRVLGSIVTRRIRHNTVMVVDKSSGAGAVMELGNQGAGGEIDNNLFVAHQGAAAAFYVTMCTGLSGLASVRNNLFSNIGANGGGAYLRYAPGGILVPTSDPCYAHAGNTRLSLPNALSEIDAYSTATMADLAGNRSLLANCGVDSSCVAACANADACNGYLFASWSPSDSGFALLLSPGTGWKMNSTADCLLRASSFSRAVALDLFGNPRSLSKPSMGAHENTAGCP